MSKGAVRDGQTETEGASARRCRAMRPRRSLVPHAGKFSRHGPTFA
jgi:hypothetical protein